MTMVQSDRTCPQCGTRRAGSICTRWACPLGTLPDFSKPEPAPVPADQEEALRDARALRDELMAYAAQLIRAETQAGFAGQDLSVRVKEPAFLARLLTRAASALQVRAWVAAEAKVDQLASELRQRDHLLALRTRQNTQASQAWARAAGQALAGDPRSLHDRLRLHRDSAATDAKVVQSALSDPRPSPAKGDDHHGA